MLLESFAKQLDILRALNCIDASTCGAEAAESFVVEVRVSLASVASSVVELPAVGSLVRDGDSVAFRPTETLKQNVGSHELLLPGIYRSAFPFRKREQPEPGLLLLRSIGTSFFYSKLAEDPKLQRVPLNSVLEIFCFGIHDTICSGSGVELESIGTFTPDLKFEIDDVLSASIKHSRRDPPGNGDGSDSTISLIRTDDT